MMGAARPDGGEEGGFQDREGHIGTEGQQLKTGGGGTFLEPWGPATGRGAQSRSTYHGGFSRRLWRRRGKKESPSVRGKSTFPGVKGRAKGKRETKQQQGQRTPNHQIIVQTKDRTSAVHCFERTKLWFSFAVRSLSSKISFAFC